MGQQINFWMTIEDEAEFLDILRKEDVLWSYYHLNFNEHPVLYELDDWKIKNQAQKVIITRRKDKNHLEFEHISKSADFKAWTRVGCNSSPCFEWNTCKRNNGTIARGRIYLSTHWYDEKKHQVYQKEAELIKWFNRLTAKLRKKGEKYEHNGQYVMVHANHLLKAKKIELKPY